MASRKNRGTVREGTRKANRPYPEQPFPEGHLSTCKYLTVMRARGWSG